MRPPGESPMKALVTQGLLATRSNPSRSYLGVLETTGPWFASLPAMPGHTGKRNPGENFFDFTCFHGPSAAHPHRRRLLTRSGKVGMTEALVGLRVLAKVLIFFDAAFHSPGFSLTLFKFFLTSTERCEGKPSLSQPLIGWPLRRMAAAATAMGKNRAAEDGSEGAQPALGPP